MKVSEIQGSYWPLCDDLDPMRKECKCFLPESEAETALANKLNTLVFDCVFHGGDPGGPYFEYPEEVYKSACKVAEIVYDMILKQGSDNQ